VLPTAARLEVLSTVLDCEASKAHIAVIVNASIRLYNLSSRACNCNLLGVFLTYALILQFTWLALGFLRIVRDSLRMHIIYREVRYRITLFNRSRLRVRYSIGRCRAFVNVC
jgi:hypothetical protein